MARRILALVLKELLVTLRDRKSRIVLIALPLVQLLIFPHAATFEVRNVDLLTFNEDRGQAGRELVAAFAAAAPFRWRGHVAGEAELRRAMESGRAGIALRIPEGFSADLAAGRPVAVQAILDGRNSNTALIAAGYARRIVARAGGALAPGGQAGPETRAFYNPNLRSKWFILPGLVGVLALVVALSVTAFSLAREKEAGTYDQLRVTPLGAPELVIGKTAPALVIGLAESAVFAAVATLGYGVPLAGDLALLALATAVFLLAVVGIGLAISALAATQQQALFGGFLFVVPAVILSGFATPVENMPDAIEALTQANPLRHYIDIARGVFLKDMPSEVYWARLWPMAAIAAVTLAGAAAVVRR